MTDESKTRVKDVRRALVVFKASKLDRYRDDGTLYARKNDDDADVKAVYGRLTAAHEEHEASVRGIEKTLQRHGLEVTRATHPRKADVARADLVVAVGGDGTFLWTARKVGNVPMLGVNSAPGASTGHYCAANMETFPQFLDEICTGKLEPTDLPRLSLTLNGNRIPYTASNDVLFAHRCPAASSRYLLRVGEESEMQVSSGIWIATQPGSTGAISSAGGETMTLGDLRLQYRVNNAYRGRGERPSLLAGFHEGPIKIVSRSPNNAIFLDGPTLSYRVDFGSVLKVALDARPLRVYGYGKVPLFPRQA